MSSYLGRLSLRSLPIKGPSTEWSVDPAGFEPASATVTECRVAITLQAQKECPGCRGRLQGFELELSGSVPNRDLIEKHALELPIGRNKTGKGTRVRSESHRGNHLVFLNETVNGKIPLGWIMPLLAGFRANVLWNKPKARLLGLCR